MSTLSRRRFLRSGVAALVLAGLAGCGTKKSRVDEQKNIEELQRIGEMYLEFAKRNRGRGPGEENALYELAQEDSESLHAYHQLVAKKYILNLDVTIPEGKLDEAAAKKVLGHERKTPISGGLVLFLDGSVQKVTAEEFSELEKAESEGITFGGTRNKQKDRKKGKED